MSANDELQAHTCEKILQEYEDVANNVAQANSQDLTDKWKKGELKECRNDVNHIISNVHLCKELLDLKTKITNAIGEK